MWTNRFGPPADLTTLGRRFKTSIEAAEAIWGVQAFKRPGRDQALAGLYDAQMVALSEFSTKALSALVNKRQEAVVATGALFDDPEFDEAVRRGTNTPARLRYRTERMLGVLQEIAEAG